MNNIVSVKWGQDIQVPIYNIAFYDRIKENMAFEEQESE
jgi:hypothetical protein